MHLKPFTYLVFSLSALVFLSCTPTKNIDFRFDKIENLRAKSITVSYVELDGVIIIENPQLISGGNIRSKQGLTLYFDDIEVQQIQITDTKIAENSQLRVPLTTALINYNNVYDKEYKDKPLGFLKRVKDERESKVIEVRLKGILTCTSGGKTTSIRVDTSQGIQIE